MLNPPFLLQNICSHFFLKIQKLTFLMVLSWCFHENCQFFDVCEIPVTGDSLVLFFPQKNWNWGLFDSEIFKELEVLDNCTSLVSTCSNVLFVTCYLQVLSVSFLFHFHFFHVVSSCKDIRQNIQAHNSSTYLFLQNKHPALLFSWVNLHNLPVVSFQLLIIAMPHFSQFGAWQPQHKTSILLAPSSILIVAPL